MASSHPVDVSFSTQQYTLHVGDVVAAYTSLCALYSTDCPRTQRCQRGLCGGKQRIYLEFLPQDEVRVHGEVRERVAGCSLRRLTHSACSKSRTPRRSMRSGCSPWTTDGALHCTVQCYTIRTVPNVINGDQSLMLQCILLLSVLI
jgi:hypothetical protein